MADKTRADRCSGHDSTVNEEILSRSRSVKGHASVCDEGPEEEGVDMTLYNRIAANWHQLGCLVDKHTGGIEKGIHAER